jgi:DNA-binding NtrC family response regulator
LKVIIVEDEMLIAQVSKMQLENNGIEVKGLASSSETFWPLMDDSIQVVLMDVKLKRGESGIALAQDIRIKYPLLPIIFTTGNTRKFVEESIVQDERIKVLNKPLIYSELIDLIRTMSAY